MDHQFKMPIAGNPYDADDPANYMNRDDRGAGSNIVSWMFGAMFAVATLIGLFFADGSPLTARPTFHITQNSPAQPAPDAPQAN